MTSTTFIVHANRNEEADGRMRLACRLAARFDARLIGLAAAIMDLPVIDPMGYAPIDAESITAERSALESDFKVAAEKLQRMATESEVRLEWRSNLQVPADMLCHEARAADLVIIGRGEVETSAGRQQVVDPGDVLMQAGRPVLIVPPGIDTLALDHVLIAWKDVRESRRAVADALPFLKVAKAVSILELCDEEEAEQSRHAVNDLAAYLNRHSITAKSDVRVASRNDPATEILTFIKEQKADLLVAGGYGHTRLREWVFGGVTRAMIATSPVCCFLSH